MIATLTLNPAVDKTTHIQKLKVGELNRLTKVQTTIGGKGINVSKTIRALKGRTEVFAITAGLTGTMVEDYLRDNYFTVHLVKGEGNTRTNIKIIEEDGAMTEINDAGPCVSKETMNLLMIRMLRSVKEGDTLVLSGSIPDGISRDIYGKIITQAKEKGIRTILDADGDCFKDGVEAIPHICKPNIHELRNYFGITEQIDVSKAYELAKKLLEKGIELVVVSMGKNGALFVWQDQAILSPAVPVKADSTVGAGDAMVGGIALADSLRKSREDLVRISMAASAAACTEHASNTLMIQSLMSSVTIHPYK